MSSPKTPLSEERIAAYLRGDLTENERMRVEEEMDRDPQWLSVLALLADDATTGSVDTDDNGSTVDRVDRAHALRLHLGDTVGRYEIRRALGRGGMGTVYAARDPKLERWVALKLLHATDGDEQERLLLEARALAQINDPHVVTVHDVGTWRQRVFLAMELLEGQTLLQWRTQSTRSWQDVLGVFLPAGRGLQAAHAAGLVHRDFKPSNVMITDDGRVVVLDFGLAIEHDPRSESDPARPRSRVGTPAYMAPEQRRGEPGSPGSDQFSYCVALLEALDGTLPPAAVTSSRSAAFTGVPDVPQRLRRVLGRGLAHDPHARHPSMAALLEALARGAKRRRVELPIGAGLLAVGAMLWPPSFGAEEPCSGSRQQMERTWSSTRAASVRTALLATGRPWSPNIADKVDARLHDYTEAWVVEHETACLAAQQDDRRAQARLEARMLCLDRRRRALDALLEVLEHPDEETGLHAVQATDALAPVELCRSSDDLSNLQSGSSNEERTKFEAIRDRLSYVEALRDSGRLDDARREARQTLKAAVAADVLSLEAEARLALGWIEHDLGDLAPAEEQLRLALQAAIVSRNDAAATTALNRLAWVVGYKLARHEEGRKLCTRAEAWSDRLGGRYDDTFSQTISRGWIETEAGEPELALQHFEAAADLARAQPATNLVAAYDLGLALNGIGAAQLSAGDLESSEQALAQATVLLEAKLGPAHPKVAQVRNNRGGVLRAMARFQDAYDVFSQTRDAFGQAYAGQHNLGGQTAVNLAVILTDLGRYEEAVERADEAIQLFGENLEGDHPWLARAFAARGDAYIQLERYDEAIHDLHLAIAQQTELLGPDHPSVGIYLTNFSIVYDKLDRLEEAATHQQRALEILQRALGDEHHLVAGAQLNLGFLKRRQGLLTEALDLYHAAVENAPPTSLPLALLGTADTLLQLGNPRAALDPLEKARALLVDAPPSTGSLGETLFLLGKAHAALGERAEARALGSEAVRVLRAAGDEELEEKVSAWLSQLG